MFRLKLIRGVLVRLYRGLHPNFSTTDCISPFYELNETLNMDDLGTIRQVKVYKTSNTSKKSPSIFKIEKPDIDDGTELDEESCVGTITSERKLGGKFYW